MHPQPMPGRHQVARHGDAHHARSDPRDLEGSHAERLARRGRDGPRSRPAHPRGHRRVRLHCAARPSERRPRSTPCRSSPPAPPSTSPSRRFPP
ncbi:MAG: hypothetical protein ACK559_34520, partial [bacterium]